jgi:hypothetical protein
MTIKSVAQGGLSGGKFASLSQAIKELVDPFEMAYIIQAGGGGGGDRRAHPGWGMHNGGGGGGGGHISSTGVIFESGVDYAVSIGAAGSAGSGADNSKTDGGSGGNTTLAYKDGTFTAVGGGGGGVGSYGYEAGDGLGRSGGSGGGGGTHFANVPYNSDGGRPGGTGTVGQGNDGGDGGRGGGAVGGNGGSYIEAGGNKGSNPADGTPFQAHTGLMLTETKPLSNSDVNGALYSGQGGGTSSTGGGGFVYIVFDSSLTATVGPGLSASEITQGNRKSLFIYSGSDNISFS